MIEQALTAGFLSVGMDVLLLGPLPTPAVGFLTRSMRADVGVMISASHNPYEDNGIKLFGPDGFKLSDAVEMQIEALVESHADIRLAAPATIGRAKRLDDAEGRYIEAVKASAARGLDLSGLKIVVDCANGAAYKVAPTVLWELGAEVIPIAVKPDGFNINGNCGSTHPGAAAGARRDAPCRHRHRARRRRRPGRAGVREGQPDRRRPADGDHRRPVEAGRPADRRRRWSRR